MEFSKSPLNPTDSVILCQLSYLPLDGIVPGPGEKNGISISLASNMIMEKLKSASDPKPRLMYKDDPQLLNTLASSDRFGKCRLFGYVNHIDTDREVQFSAVCVYTNDGCCFIVFRGTDLSFVGWKEDFNMSFKEVIPAQIEAANYLKMMASMIKGPLRLGGHSKGGNLAIYAAANCRKRIQKRIREIYSNDAPGFHKNVIESEGFTAIRDRIRSYIPQDSVVGMLLEHGYDYTVIKSSQAGLLQHDMYSWEMTHNNMVHVDSVTLGSRFVDKTLRGWIDSLDIEQRKQFFDALFSIINSSEAKSLPELEFKAVSRIIKSLGSIDEPTRNLINKTLGELFNAARRNIDTLLKPEKNE